MHVELCTVRQASEYLSMSEQELLALSDKGIIPARVQNGGYLRFEKADLVSYRKTHPRAVEKVTLGERIYDLFYFHDFTIMATVIIAVLIAVIAFR